MNLIDRLKAAWLALRGQPFCTSLPPVGLLEIEPDDQLLLQHEAVLSQAQIEALKIQIYDWLAGRQRVAVLSGGLKLVAVRRKPNIEVRP
jgi:hypothetical protein